jgi:predicted amidohydrolase YtcJ
MLIRNAQVWQTGLADVRIHGSRVGDIGSLTPQIGERIVDAAGGLLLPGLHDHHIHLAALAAKASSVPCGPPNVFDAAALRQALARPGDGWLRGVGYHESVAGMLDAAMLDEMAGQRPVRIQHRSGRLWFLNTRAIDALAQRGALPLGLDWATGRLFDEDNWLRATLAGTPPGFGNVSVALAERGVTGITDMSPANDPAMAAHFRTEQAAGRLRQRVVLAGSLALAEAAFDASLTLGPAKLHLHEAAFPDLDDATGFVRHAHAQGRAVAVHCTTEAELVFALATIDAAGARRGDRIEHAGVAPDPLIAEMVRLKLHAVSQPHFITERGDVYAKDVEPRDLPALYRLRAFLNAGLTLAAGSDAPYGEVDPWASMAAAVSRTTRDGIVLGAQEALTPEEALCLYLADPLDLGRQRHIAPGCSADLCLLDRNWDSARTRLSAYDVRLTLINGDIVYDRVDQPPVEGRSCVDTAA